MTSADTILKVLDISLATCANISGPWINSWKAKTAEDVSIKLHMLHIDFREEQTMTENDYACTLSQVILGATFYVALLPSICTIT